MRDNNASPLRSSKKALATPRNLHRGFDSKRARRDRARSMAAAGTPDGHFRLLYWFEDEQLSELRNATVHAFVSMSILPPPGCTYTTLVSSCSRCIGSVACTIQPSYPLTSW